MTKKTTKRKEAPKIERKKMSKAFWFDLEDVETKEFHKEQNELILKKEEDEEKKKAVTKEWSDKIKEKQKRISEIAHILGKGKELREVDCVMIKDFTKKEVRWEVDGKVIETREMKDDEAQMGLSLEERAEKAKEIRDNISETKLRAEAQEHVEKKKGKQPGALKTDAPRKGKSKAEKDRADIRSTIMEQTNPRTARSAAI